MAAAVSTPWTKSTLSFFALFWVLQFTAVVSHISFITFWIGFLAAKSNVGVLKYVYLTLLISTLFFLALLTTELIFHFRSSLTLERYHKLQIIKVRISLIEMLALGILCHGVEDPTGTVWMVMVLTAGAGIPFNFSFGLAVFMKRREKKRLEMETKGVDEETPLLHDP